MRCAEEQITSATSVHATELVEYAGVPPHPACATMHVIAEVTA